MRMNNFEIIKNKIEKGEKLRIGIDQDWVLAKLTDKWVKTYNTIFDDNLKVEDIKTWNICDFVKPEAKDFMLNILNIHKFYRDLDIVSDSQRVLKKLQDEGHELFIVTDFFTRMSFKAKHDWLLENFPFIDKKNHIYTGNKSAVALDILIDDGLHNCESFQGLPLLYDAPYNRDCDEYFRVKNWQDIEHIFDRSLRNVVDFYKNECILEL